MPPADDHDLSFEWLMMLDAALISLILSWLGVVALALAGFMIAAAMFFASRATSSIPRSTARASRQRQRVTTLNQAKQQMQKNRQVALPVFDD